MLLPSIENLHTSLIKTVKNEIHKNNHRSLLPRLQITFHRNAANTINTFIVNYICKLSHLTILQGLGHG